MSCKDKLKYFLNQPLKKLGRFFGSTFSHKVDPKGCCYFLTLRKASATDDPPGPPKLESL